MKRIAIIAMVAGALLCSCVDSTKVNFSFDHPERYSVGDATIEQPVKSINIDWLSGDVDIRYSDNPELRIYEEITETSIPLTDTLRMHYNIDEEGELDIKFCGKGKYRYGNLKDLNKHLYVDVPRGMTFDEINIDGVQCNVRIVGVHSRELTVDGVKVNVNTHYLDSLPDEIDLDGVSCLLAIHVLPTAGLTIEMSGVRPELTCDLPSKKEGEKTIVGDGQCKVEADGVNVKLCIGEIKKGA